MILNDWVLKRMALRNGIDLGEPEYFVMNLSLCVYIYMFRTWHCVPVPVEATSS